MDDKLLVDGSTGAGNATGAGFAAPGTGSFGMGKPFLPIFFKTLAKIS